ncbi:PE family protein [Mycobacterium gastri]|uniref:PE family protein n=1 Tax=Mycobacterium gastri TaxID=1777 RepID=UPI0003E5394B|nr:PE family protein [Mycobacterium gastri]ETW25359.1 hypothetical protein MGAST_03110 [Mycobacterium gastri 'Wayne']
MSLVIAAPEMLAAAAAEMSHFGSSLHAANAAAPVRTTGLLAAAEDGVSVAVAALSDRTATPIRCLSAQAAKFHIQFAQTLAAAAASYAGAEADAGQTLLNIVNSPAQVLWGARCSATGSTGPVPVKTAGPAGC